MSVILSPVPQTLAGQTLRQGPLAPAPIHAATMAGPVATTQLKQAVRAVDGLSDPDRADFVPKQHRKERPEPEQLLGPRPSFAANLLDALPEQAEPRPAPDTRHPGTSAEPEEAHWAEARKALISASDAATVPDLGSSLDLRL